VLGETLKPVVKHKRLVAFPCSSVEFPVSVKDSTRKPHYMTASEQRRIEFCAPNHLRHAIVILVETGLRPYRELMCMRKEQVDLENRMVHIPSSKTPTGVADMSMTTLAGTPSKLRSRRHLARTIYSRVRA
jgi:integrase